jgi:murein DD-endopeptidase MepM/ murein hydrolase activator NlpD
VVLGRTPPDGEPPTTFEQQPEGGSPHHGRTPDLSKEQLLGGTYSTERLVAAAVRLRAAGWSDGRIRREVFAPFVLVGPASWSDSWGAPRYGPGPIVRQHEGEDVLCRYGAEVLAPVAGTVRFETGLLGGRSAHLYRPNGSYFYFAHFSEWNDRLSDGDEVRPGDVIGYCGDTGNATVPHVHVGHYGPDGVAIDPMRRLISWLREAEADLPAAGIGAAGGFADALDLSEPTDIVRTLQDDPLPDAGLFAWRNVAWIEPYDSGALDLTPVLVFLVLFSLNRRRGTGPPRGTAWSHRKGPLLP